MKETSKGPQCIECGRVFDLFNAIDAMEVYGGHDCEVEE